jgi:type II secretory pathway pseudopilin PulG
VEVDVKQRNAKVRESGMSLIEVLVAVAIMMTIALGIIPLFTRSIRQNKEGDNYTNYTNVARTTLEEIKSLDINAPQLTIASARSVRNMYQYWSNATQTWWSWDTTAGAWANLGGLPTGADDGGLPAPAPANALWYRTITVEQFTAGDLTDDKSLDFPLPGSADAMNVHYKRVRVAVQPLWRLEILGRPTPISLEVIKAF